MGIRGLKRFWSEGLSTDGLWAEGLLKGFAVEELGGERMGDERERFREGLRGGSDEDKKKFFEGVSS